MDSVTRGLEAWGVPVDCVHTEAFGPASVRQAVRGPAAQPDCGVDVTFARSGVTAQWSRCRRRCSSWPRNIRWAIDFGCRAGSCGTCVTQVLSGAVRYLHQPNAPLEADKVLPCIAVPAEPLHARCVTRQLDRVRGGDVGRRRAMLSCGFMRCRHKF